MRKRYLNGKRKNKFIIVAVVITTTIIIIIITTITFSFSPPYLDRL
jgi:hypothetical protein